MHALHQKAVAEKSISTSDEIVTSYLERNLPPNPPLIQSESAKIRYVRPFHTFQLSNGIEKEARVCLLNALESYKQAGLQIAVNNDLWVYTVKIRHKTVEKLESGEKKQ